MLDSEFFKERFMQQWLLKKNGSWWVDCLFLTALLGSLFFILLGVRPLFVPDEGRYAEIAREMAASGNYITPYLDGIKYFEKPILFYWLGAAAIKIGGVNLWSLRSINALLSLIGCLATYFTTRKLYDRPTGLLAACILGTSLLYFIMAHMIALDLPVTIFISICLYAFILAIQNQPATARRHYLWTAALFAALAVLTKGLIGIVFPFLIVVTWIIIRGEYRRLHIMSCILIFMMVVTPWHVMVGLQNPEFFYFYFIEQHFLRYTNAAVGHYQPFWFFIPCLIIGFFPWIVFLPQAIVSCFPTAWKERKKHGEEIFFMLWAIIIFTFFSFSKSKLIPYIVPVFPPIAILTAIYLGRALEKNRTPLGIRLGYVAFVVFSAAFAYLFYDSLHTLSLADPDQAMRWLGLGAVILLIGSILSCVYAFYHLPKALIIQIATMWLFLMMIMASIPALDTRTIRPLAIKLKPLLKPSDEIVTYNQYYQDLPFYLERNVSVLNWQNEMRYGIAHQAMHGWFLNNDEFAQHWNSQRRVFVIMSKEEYGSFEKRFAAKSGYIVDRTANNILICNQLLQDKPQVP